jgi:DNA-directed RNA polymerase subunit RPC12/RpoP
MKVYKCFECEEEKPKAKFHAGALDYDPVLWTCKKCSKEANDYENSPDFLDAMATSRFN